MIPSILKTAFWAILPLVEIRASIPMGYLEYGLELWQSVVVSVVAGILLTWALVYGLPVLVYYTQRHIYFLHQILEWFLERTRRKHSQKMILLGDIMLITFVAIPLPGSGVWSGVLVSYLFGVSKKKSILLISIGLCFSALIIAGITEGGFLMWQYFNQRT